MGAKLFRADGKMDITKLVVAFRNFEKALKNARTTLPVSLTSSWYGAQLNIIKIVLLVIRCLNPNVLLYKTLA